MNVGARGIGTLAAIVVVANAGGCARDDSPPTRLADGSPAGVPTVELDAPKPQIVTKASSVRPSRAPRRSLAGRCIAESYDHPVGSAVVVRVGTTGSSVTFRTSSGLALVGCDGDASGKDAAHSFCGRAYARLERGRLRDPRLDLAGCTTATGDTVAFAWFQPGPKTSSVAVQAARLRRGLSGRRARSRTHQHHSEHRQRRIPGRRSKSRNTTRAARSCARRSSRLASRARRRAEAARA